MTVFDFTVAAVLLPLGAWLALARPPKRGSRRPGCPRGADRHRRGYRVRRPDLRGRRRLDPRPADRGRAPPGQSRARRALIHLRDLGGRGGRVHFAGREPPRAPTGLAHRDPAGHPRPGRRLHGARFQHRLPEAAIRHGLGAVVVAVGVVFLGLNHAAPDFSPDGPYDVAVLSCRSYDSVTGAACWSSSSGPISVISPGLTLLSLFFAQDPGHRGMA